MMDRTEKPLVLHVVRQFLPNRGGLEDVVANLCRSLPERGFRVKVVTCDRLFSEPERGLLPARETIDGIEIVRVPWRGSSRYPLAPAVFRHLGDADLIHVHAIDFFFDALSLGSILHRKPMIATTHGGFFHTKAHSRLKTIWFNTVTRLSAAGYRQLVGCSTADMRTFEPIAGARTRLIENGVDIAKFANAASLTPRRRLVTIGRFSHNKRLPLLLDLVKTLIARDPDWHLDIVGVPSDLGIEDLQAGIAARDLGSAVSLHRGLGDVQTRALIGHASLFVSASDYEGFGLVAVEAMSAGLLPVLHENVAYRDLALRHPEIALADFAQVGATADRIEAAYGALCAGGPALRDKLTAAAGRYGWDAVADRYSAVYRSVLGLADRPHHPASIKKAVSVR